MKIATAATRSLRIISLPPRVPRAAPHARRQTVLPRSLAAEPERCPVDNSPPSGHPLQPPAARRSAARRGVGPRKCDAARAGVAALTTCGPRRYTGLDLARGRSDPVTPLDYEPTVADFIRTRVERHGDRTLIVHGERRLTYADADARSRELARGLMASGVGKGTRVGVLMPNGPDWVTTWLAASRIGALVVPINTFYKPRELGWVLRHADVATLLGVDRFLSNDYVSRLEDHAPILRTPRGPFLAIEPLPFLRHVWLQGGAPPAWADGSIDDLAAAGATINPGLVAEAERSVAPADPMILIYSSGSTADPKGAVHTHGATLRHAYQLNGFRDIRTDDRVYSPMPFFWVGGFVFVLLSAMHVGACLLTEEAFEPGETLAYLEREQATVVAGWPHYGKAMAAHPDFADRDLSSIRSGNIYDIVPVAMRPRDPELRPTALGMTETCGPHTIE
ncbi:MAG: hypothetical protein E4H03_07575, partial [Myxococcales bacterium]